MPIDLVDYLRLLSAVLRAIEAAFRAVEAALRLRDRWRRRE